VVEAGAMPPQALIDLLKKAKAPVHPVVVYAPQELSAEDDRRLRLAVFGGFARLARTSEQLIDQVSLLLHQRTAALTEAARGAVNRTRHDDAVLKGRKVMVIDDDIRNIFSLASALEEYGLELIYAESGRAGLDLLDQHPDVDAILVDIMMPDMDGYETIREVRTRRGFADLPVVAVTAKAMKGDRQKCIEAGASDYVSKPVDIDHLTSVLRVGIQRTDGLRAAADARFATSPQAR
jgi:CheY-like chemotaxis protein